MSLFELYATVKVIFGDGLLIAVLLHMITLLIQYITIRYAKSKICLRLLVDFGIVMPEKTKIK